MEQQQQAMMSGSVSAAQPRKEYLGKMPRIYDSRLARLGNAAKHCSPCSRQLLRPDNRWCGVQREASGGVCRDDAAVRRRWPKNVGRLPEAPGYCKYGDSRIGEEDAIIGRRRQVWTGLVGCAH